MARKITGHPEWRGGRWQVQATGPDGKRRWYDLPASIGREQGDLAKAVGQRVAEGIRRGDVVPTEREETVSEWYADYYKAAAIGAVGRKNRGRPQSSVDDRRARFRSWIEPVIGTKAMGAVTSADLRRVVQKLDEAIRTRAAFYAEGGTAEGGRKPGLSAKTAQNVWSECTNGFAEAVSSKLDELRVLEVNPAIGVLPPATADDREQAALFPTEVVQLLACEAIPVSRRRCYAVAIYTGMRRSELARLEAADVDFIHALIKVRGTKTTAAKRTIQIEPSLRTLLETLADERPHGPLLDVPRADGKGGAADLMRKDLRRAGLTRADLFRDDAEHMPFTFHGLRHTCITHWVVAGRDQVYLLTAGGHTDVEMTKRYLAAASSLSATFGQPHPALPGVLAIAQISPKSPETLSGTLTFPRQIATPAGIEGEPTAPETPSNAANRSQQAPSAATTDGDSNGEDDDPDIALKAAIKAAVDAGLYDRARALLDVLAKTGQPADVVLIRERGRR